MLFLDPFVGANPTKKNVSFPTLAPPSLFSRFALALFFARAKYPSLSLLPDPTKTLATQARRYVATGITCAVSMGWNNGREPP